MRKTPSLPPVSSVRHTALPNHSGRRKQHTAAPQTLNWKLFEPRLKRSVGGEGARWPAGLHFGFLHFVLLLFWTGGTHLQQTKSVCVCVSPNGTLFPIQVLSGQNTIQGIGCNLGCNLHKKARAASVREGSYRLFYE
jgi:hypothetical protein